MVARSSELGELLVTARHHFQGVIMKRTVLISLAAGVAIVPALLGVAAATSTFGPSAPASVPTISDDSRTSTPTASSTVDDRGRDGNDADDSATATTEATSSSSSASADDRGRGSDDATASSSSSVEDRQGRDSDDATTSSPTRSATSPATSRSTSSKATTSSTVDDKGHGVEAGDDSGGHGGKN
jgi:hypothetical protein